MAFQISHLILGLAAMATAQTYKPLVYQGCYSSAGEMTNVGSYLYQTPNYCQEECVKINKPVLGTTKGSDCYCGDLLPAASDKISDSECSTKCNGFGQQTCGGDDAWGVQLTGISTNVGSVSGSGSNTKSGSSSSSNSNSNSNDDDSSSSSNSDSDPTSTAEAAPESTPTTSAAPSPSPTTTTPAVVHSTPTKGNQPSIVTHASTIVVTAPGGTRATTTVISTTEVAKKSGPNVAGIAAGVVVGVVAVAAIVGVLFFFLRNRKRKAIEESHRNSLSPGWYGQKQQPLSSSNSVSDSRLEPSVMMQRRMSDGSIADNQDYSRRILKVKLPMSCWLNRC